MMNENFGIRYRIKGCYGRIVNGWQHVDDIHKNGKWLPKAYSVIRDLPIQADLNDEILSHEKEEKILVIKSPIGNTMLHVAAMFGKYNLVDKIAQLSQKFPLGFSKFSTEQNVNGDTALHLAAKAGHISTVKKLVRVHLSSFREIFPDGEIFMANKQGNTFLHEALYNRHPDLVNQVLYDQHDSCFQSLSVPNTIVLQRALNSINNENKSILYLAIEAGYNELVDKTLVNFDLAQQCVPEGKSFFLAAILKRDLGMLETILNRYSHWINATDEERRTVVHYAASTGYLKGVEYLLGRYSSCATLRDKDGFLPIHLASYKGHLEIVQKLLQEEQCPYSQEMHDNNGRNILHLASQNGKFNVVNYILQSTNPKLQEMINEKDFDGNTPLHLATLCCHPKIVHALTWDKRVDFNLPNVKDQTPLDLCNEFSLENPSFRQRLTWVALKSAGAKHFHSLGPCYINVSPQDIKSYWNERAPDMSQYKDRINTLLLVSTLIITVTFAAGFTVPGGLNSSGQGHQGIAIMLKQIWFKLFIFCITISMYGALSVTITLIWAQLADLTVTLFALKVARPLLGVTLATLSLAFMAGLHLVISDLNWLATTTLALCVILILMLLFFYTLLWFPSTSTNIVARWFSYRPFLFLAWVVDYDET
ncbi:hypothetical protein VNO77_27495 [Canavalia gladiata]|uniref:PGG domain-containing protein n=1 Tax=Canavalia gladiata TaxID=3824 RepID=A0AAN9KVE8_CANGL